MDHVNVFNARGGDKMVEVSKSFIHWNYFLAIESDLENLSRYIEFIDANFNTYSIELARLLSASSSESDVVLKELCALLRPNEKRKDINDYKKIIKNNMSELINESIYIKRYGISVKPWDNWNGDNNFCLARFNNMLNSLPVNGQIRPEWWINGYWYDTYQYCTEKGK